MNSNQAGSNRKKVIHDQINDLRKKLSEIESEERRLFAMQLVGCCFKYRNSYAGDDCEEEGWWLYKKVVGMSEDGYILCHNFEVDCYGVVSIEINKTMLTGQKFIGHNYTKISETEYKEAWNNLLVHISEISDGL